MHVLSQSSGKRPKLVWVVFLFYLFSFGYTALSFFLIFSGWIQVRPEQAAYFRNLSAFDYTMTFLTASLNLAGAISFFLLRKIAFHLFIGTLALATLQGLMHVITTNFIAAAGSAGLVGGLIAYSGLCRPPIPVEGGHPFR